jgi:hypothetical protein
MLSAMVLPSVSDPDADWIRIQMSRWIRIRQAKIVPEEMKEKNFMFIKFSVRLEAHPGA